MCLYPALANTRIYIPFSLGFYKYVLQIPTAKNKEALLY